MYMYMYVPLVRVWFCDHQYMYSKFSKYLLCLSEGIFTFPWGGGGDFLYTFSWDNVYFLGSALGD